MAGSLFLALLWAQAAPVAETTDMPLLRDYRGEVSLPDDLYRAYAEVIVGLREGDRDALDALSLPGAITIDASIYLFPYGRKKRISQHLHLKFVRDDGPFGFSERIVRITRHSEDAYLLRTATSGLSFIKTASSGWKLYAYFDRPLERAEKSNP